MPPSRPVAVFVINLDRRTDRLASIDQSLSALGLGFTRIPAVDGRASPPPAELACARSSGPIGPCADTTRACTASHVRVWQQLLASDAGHALVLEDNVALRPEIAALVADDAWVPAGVDLVKLEKYAPGRPSKILAGPVLAQVAAAGTELRRMYSRHTGSAAYVISRRGAEVALADIGSYDVPVDHLLFNETVSRLCARLRPAIMVPPLAWQDVTAGQGSDIAPPAGVAATLRKRPWQNIPQSLRRARLEMRLLPMQLLRLLTGQARLVTLATPQATGKALPALMRKLRRID